MRLPAILPLTRAVFIIAVLPLRAGLVEVSWKGGATGNWSDSANWNPATAFPNNLVGSSTTYNASITAAAVNLTQNITVTRLAMTDSSLSGPFVLNTNGLWLRLAGSNRFDAGLVYQATKPFGFANSATLTNHGTIEFRTPFDGDILPFASGTLVNAQDGLVRLHPTNATSLGNEYTIPFYLRNDGLFLTNNFRSNSLYAPVTQSETGAIHVTGASSALELFAGGTLAGTLHVGAGATLKLRDSPSISIPQPTYTLEETAITGTGLVIADHAKITGALASGSLTLEHMTFTGTFTNQAAGTLFWASAEFLDESASLTNYGTVELYTHHHGYEELHFPSGIPPGGIFTNAVGGLARLNPAAAVEITPAHDDLTNTSKYPFTFLNQGTLLIDNGLLNILGVPVTNQGLIHITPGSSLMFWSENGSFLQTGGETHIENARLGSRGDHPLSHVFRGGVLRATGTLDAAIYLTNSVFEIGTARSVGAVYFGSSQNAALRLGPGASTHFDLAGLIPGTGHDTLTFSNGAVLGGELVLHLTPAFAATLKPSDTLTLFSAPILIGAFSNIQSDQRLKVSDGTASFLVTVTNAVVQISGFAPSAFLNALVTATVPIAQRTPEADPDADGIPNLLEYALELEPMRPDATGLPAIQSSGPDLALTYKHARSDVVYSVQTSDDITDPTAWTTTGVDQGTPDVNGLVTARTPVGTQSRFLRLVVTLTP